MGKIYVKNQETCKLAKAKPETVQFLLNYSKSLKIIKAKGITFENNMN